MPCRSREMSFPDPTDGFASGGYRPPVRGHDARMATAGNVHPAARGVTVRSLSEDADQQSTDGGVFLGSTDSPTDADASPVA